MADRSQKLVTWKQWVLALSAAAIGTHGSLYWEYRDTGSVRPASIVSAAIAFCFCVALTAAIFWYANRPESEGKR